MGILRGTRAQFHAALDDNAHQVEREHLFRELDLAVIRHAARSRRAVRGGIRRTITHFPGEDRALVTAAPHQLVPAPRSSGVPEYVQHAAAWLRCIHLSHSRFATDGLATFDDTCRFTVTVEFAVFPILAETLMDLGDPLGNRITWHGIEIHRTAGPGPAKEPDMLHWQRHGQRARTGTSYICPDDINFGLYLMFDTQRHQAQPASTAAKDVMAWYRTGQVGNPTFPWPIGECRPFDVTKPPAPKRRRAVGTTGSRRTRTPSLTTS
jgi:hypothetical protein